MRTPASIFKHSIHPMLVVFPIGLWNFSLACDLIRLGGASGDAWSIKGWWARREIRWRSFEHPAGRLRCYP